MDASPAVGTEVKPVRYLIARRKRPSSGAAGFMNDDARTHNRVRHISECIWRLQWPARRMAAGYSIATCESHRVSIELRGYRLLTKYRRLGNGGNIDSDALGCSLGLERLGLVSVLKI